MADHQPHLYISKINKQGKIATLTKKRISNQEVRRLQQPD